MSKVVFVHHEQTIAAIAYPNLAEYISIKRRSKPYKLAMHVHLCMPSVSILYHINEKIHEQNL